VGFGCDGKFGGSFELVKGRQPKDDITVASFGSGKVPPRSPSSNSWRPTGFIGDLSGVLEVNLWRIKRH